MLKLVLTWFMPLPFFLAGLMVCTWGWLKHQEGKRTLAWTAVDGTVLSTQTEQTMAGNSINPERRAIGVVRYRYRWNGKDYEGNRVGLMNRSYLTPWLAARSIRAYSAGLPVKVFVNPSAPGEAVLVPGPGQGSTAMLAAGVVMALSGLIVSQVVLRLGLVS